jgi:hypothetical protein
VVIVLIVSPSLRLRDQEAILDLRVRPANGTAVNVLPPVVVCASNRGRRQAWIHSRQTRVVVETYN